MTTACLVRHATGLPSGTGQTVQTEHVWVDAQIEHSAVDTRRGLLTGRRVARRRGARGDGVRPRRQT
eukprot:190127-Rhodomonas_salina.1